MRVFKVSHKGAWGRFFVDVLNIMVSFVEAIDRVCEARRKCSLHFARDVPRRSCIFVLMKEMYEGVQSEPQGSLGVDFFVDVLCRMVPCVEAIGNVCEAGENAACFFARDVLHRSRMCVLMKEIDDCVQSEPKQGWGGSIFRRSVKHNRKFH